MSTHFFQDKILKWILLITLSCIWGSSFILIKKGLEHFGYVQAATIRLTAAGIVLFPFALYQFKNIPKTKWKFILLTSLSAMVVPAYLFCFAQQYVPSSLAGIINSLTPTFTFLISLLFFKNKYITIQMVGLALGLLGSIFLSILSSKGNFEFNPFALLIVLATICYGININIVKNYLYMVKPWAVSTSSVALAGLLAVLITGIPNASSFAIDSVSIYSFLALVILGLLGTALAIVLHNELIKISSPLFASANTYLIPIVAIFWGTSVGESVSINHVIGVGIIFLAIVLIRKQPN